MRSRQRLTVLVLIAIVTPAAAAQGLRVEAEIHDVSDSAADSPGTLLSSSLSLFHNGRAYDYVERADEVVIYQPAARRFTILNPARSLATTVDFDEIGHMLKSRGPEAEAYIGELLQANTPDSRRLVRSLRFQLDPRFESQFDPRGRTLTMTSPSWKYRVSTRPWDDVEQLQHYLTYCDWTAKLNSILHPSSNFPEPRMALNTNLRETKNQMPVTVELDLRPDEDRVLRAEYRFTPNLDDIDRDHIRRWDMAAESSRLKRLSFRKYQKAVLISQTR